MDHIKLRKTVRYLLWMRECDDAELEENDIDVEDSITHRAAVMYLTLQDFAVAL